MATITVKDAAGVDRIVNTLPANDGNTLPVVGPATDAQLRASPLPISGALTDTQLRATPLPISGALTDAQLRAAPLPVSGGLTDTQLRASALATVADGFAKTLLSTTITRQANTTAYAAGQLVGGSATAGFANNGFTFVGFARTPGGVVRFERARFYKSQATATGNFELRLYRAQPTITIGDAGTVSTGVPVGAAGATARLIGRIPFDMTTAVIGPDGAELAALPLTSSPILTTLPAGASDMFGLLVATSAYTPASGEMFSVVLEGYSF